MKQYVTPLKKTWQRVTFQLHHGIQFGLFLYHTQHPECTQSVSLVAYIDMIILPNTRVGWCDKPPPPRRHRGMLSSVFSGFCFYDSAIFYQDGVHVWWLVIDWLRNNKSVRHDGMSGQLPPSWPRGRQSESCTQAEHPPCPFFLVQDSSTHPLVRQYNTCIIWPFPTVWFSNCWSLFL